MIAKTFTDSFVAVQKLVENFHKDINEYLKSSYQEAEVRQHFLDKFFIALGWDVYNDEHSNPYEREVKIEKSVMVQGRGKRADYAFYTAPNFTQARFMAEAKKPSKQLENAQDCFQAIRYGWNSNTPISVLTDFEQFLVLDSRYKPNVETATQRIIREKSFTYTDYADEEKFREIYYLFSREAVFNNSLETFAKSLKGGRGAKQSKLFNTSIIQPMDEEFLSELDEQRVVLAKAFKNRNAELDGETLTEITQRTLDRLVFLRFLEDKLVEPDSVIDNLGKKSGSAWRDFIGEMPRLNQTYNGTLFKKHSLLDNPNFAPDERAFEQTRDWLSHFNSPYDFNSIPIHILGSIYERFLGKTIVATDKRATVEDKPEVRKAGGVYYTPEYIVRYIVENTIGKLIEKKKPEEIAEMRFADIACGSGSFLLGVFDYLISYHVEWFSENKTRREKAIKDGLCRETIEGTLQLSIQYKREILTNNIYGVDLDAQAVEVAQLSLYLKLLEEETTATKQQFLSGFREQLLPSLKDNIIHGNSLIDYDVMDGMLFDTRELKQLNPMNFQSTFLEVFDKGGFDAIVGNPPYVSIQSGFISDDVYKHLKIKYSTMERISDLFGLFTEQAVGLLKDNGYWGFIIPSVAMLNLSFIKLRKLLLESTSVKNIAHLGDGVFVGAVVPTCVIVSNKQINPKNQINVIQTDRNPYLENARVKTVEQNFYLELENYVFNVDLTPEKHLLSQKLLKKSFPLDNFLNVKEGIKTGNDKIFLSEEPFEQNSLKILKGRDIEKYFNNPKLFINYDANKLSRPQKKELFQTPEKLFIRRVGENLVSTYDNEQLFCVHTLYVANLINEDYLYSIKYFLGLLNSKLMNFYYHANNLKKGNTFPEVRIYSINSLPIRKVDFDNSMEKALHDKIIDLVDKLLLGKNHLFQAQTDKDKLFYERYCNSLEIQIDAAIFSLYELTADEIKIVSEK